MRRSEGSAPRVYRAVARAIVRGRLDDGMIDDMAGVFGRLWRERRGPGARARLLLREGVGLLRMRGRLPDRRRSRRGHADWNGRDVMGELVRDFRVGLRVLSRTPVATLAAVVTLALGIGGTTAVFTVVDGVVLDPMSFPESGRLVTVLESLDDGGLSLTSRDNFDDLRTESRTLEALGLYRGNSVAVTGLGEPERIRGEFVTASYFDVLGVQPALGRPIGPGEDEVGGDRTVVISHGYWVRRFASDPEILGRTVQLNNLPHTIVGVMPPRFRSYWDATEAWISAHTAPGSFEGRGARGFFGIGRLAAGVDVATADRELDAIMGQLAEAYPDVNADRTIYVAPLAQWVAGEERRTLVWSLLGAIGMVLLIAVANVANLQLARAGHRSREMAIRAALGGGRSRLLSQLLVENVLLALLGGVLGLAVAWLSLRLLLTTGDSPFSSFDVALSTSTFVAAGFLTLGAGVSAGLLPALRGSTTRPAGQLREDGRSGSEGRVSRRFRSGLIVSQMAMAVTLLIAAGLLLRTTAALGGVDVGFDTTNLLTGETRLTAEAYQDIDARRAYLEQVVDRLRSIPGTRGGTLIAGMPFSGDGSSMPLRVEGSELSFEEAPTAFVPVVAHGYFEFMGVPVIAGRTFERTDDADSELVVVVSSTLAGRLFPELDPIGRRIESPEGSARIIGVVEDTRRALTSEVEPTAYLHYLQAPPTLFSVLIRTEDTPEAHRRALQEAFWSVDSNQPLWEVMSLESRMSAYTSGERFTSRLLAAFAGLALLLAGVGMYGVIAHGVGRRRHELGIRLALGAGERRVLRMVIRQGLTLTIVGAVLGVGAAAALARLLASVLYGVGAYDPVSFAVAPAVLLAVAVVAIYIPARRATRVDPVEAFRG